MTAEEIHDTVHNAIYGDDDRSLDQIQRDTHRFGAFDFLTNWGEQFDGYSSVIVSPDPATILVFHRPYVECNNPRRLPVDFVVAHCSYSGFINTSAAFVEWFDGEANRLRQHEP